MKLQVKDADTVFVQLTDAELSEIVDMMKGMPDLNQPAETLLETVAIALGGTEYIDGPYPGTSVVGYFEGDMTMEEARALLLVAGIKSATISSEGESLMVFLNAMFDDRYGQPEDADEDVLTHSMRSPEFEQHILNGIWPVEHRVPGEITTLEALDAEEKKTLRNISTECNRWKQYGISLPDIEAAVEAKDIDRIATLIVFYRDGDNGADLADRCKADILNNFLQRIAVEINNIWEINRRRAELFGG